MVDSNNYDNNSKELSFLVNMKERKIIDKNSVNIDFSMGCYPMVESNVISYSTNRSELVQASNDDTVSRCDKETSNSGEEIDRINHSSMSEDEVVDKRVVSTRKQVTGKQLPTTRRASSTIAVHISQLPSYPELSRTAFEGFKACIMQHNSRQQIMEAMMKTIKRIESSSSWQPALNNDASDSDLANLLRHTNLDVFNDDAFYIADMDEVRRQYREWIRLLPRVDPFYAVKCNPDPVLLKVLASMGVGFDCASKRELESVLKLCAISRDQIIYANTCKPVSHLRYAAQNRVSHMTFDNADELWKIRKYYPAARLLIRIRVDDRHSSLPLGKKFGASLHLVPQLFILARHLGLQVVGVSFHVGCNCTNPQAYSDAIHMAKKCFILGEKVGFKFNILDIGGGFPGGGLEYADTSDSHTLNGVATSSHAQRSSSRRTSFGSFTSLANLTALWRSKPQVATFNQLAHAINEALNECFPLGSGTRIIAEPGRLFVERAYTLAVSVIGRRVQRPISRRYRSPQMSYTIGDGRYGSFQIPYIDRVIPRPYILRRGGQFVLDDTDINNLPFYTSIVWGPTCDAVDIVHRAILLPELNIGDWVAYSNMGAYTLAAASLFNGYGHGRIVHINLKSIASLLSV